MGWWALPPNGVLAVWIYLNPRVFPPPRTTDAWMTKGALGERIFLARAEQPIPDGHRRVGLFLTWLSVLVMGAGIVGFIMQDFWLAFWGVHTAGLIKVWFVDRMVWLYEETEGRLAPSPRDDRETAPPATAPPRADSTAPSQSTDDRTP